MSSVQSMDPTRLYTDSLGGMLAVPDVVERRKIHSILTGDVNDVDSPRLEDGTPATNATPTPTATVSSPLPDPDHDSNAEQDAGGGSPGGGGRGRNNDADAPMVDTSSDNDDADMVSSD